MTSRMTPRRQRAFHHAYVREVSSNLDRAMNQMKHSILTEDDRVWLALCIDGLKYHMEQFIRLEWEIQANPGNIRQPEEIFEKWACL